MSDSLWPHVLQYARLPCPSPVPRACSNSSIELMMPFFYLILCSPLLLLPSIFPSIRVFSNELVLHISWQSIGALDSASDLPMNIQDWSSRTDWFDLLAAQGILKFSPTPQFKSINSSVLSFMVQLSHPYMTSGKSIAFTSWTFVGKAMHLLFNMLSSIVIAFLPRSKHLLISWLQSSSAVILEPKKVKYLTVSIASTSICHEVPDVIIFFFY